jgi:hypothetical protein
MANVSLSQLRDQRIPSLCIQADAATYKEAMNAFDAAQTKRECPEGADLCDLCGCYLRAADPGFRQGTLVEPKSGAAAASALHYVAARLEIAEFAMARNLREARECLLDLCSHTR